MGNHTLTGRWRCSSNSRSNFSLQTVKKRITPLCYGGQQCGRVRTARCACTPPRSHRTHKHICTPPEALDVARAVVVHAPAVLHALGHRRFCKLHYQINKVAVVRILARVCSCSEENEGLQTAVWQEDVER